jgi:exodeoxyribonuclease VII large subunit
MDPKAVLKRGYSITRTLPHSKVLTNATEAFEGQTVEIILHQGELLASVKKIKE